MSFKLLNIFLKINPSIPDFIYVESISINLYTHRYSEICKLVLVLKAD